MQNIDRVHILSIDLLRNYNIFVNSLCPDYEFVCTSFRTDNLNCFRVNGHDEQRGDYAKI